MPKIAVIENGKDWLFYWLLAALIKIGAALAKIVNESLFAFVYEDWPYIDQDPNSFAKDCPGLYKILNYFSFLKASLEDYLTYEETVPILHKACKFKDYQFYKRSDIVNLVQALPDDQFNIGENVHREPVRTNTFKDLSPTERGKSRCQWIKLF